MPTVFLLALLATTGAASDLQRVRASDQRIVSAINDGLTRSGAFRDLISRVEESDVIVYIEMQSELRGGRLMGGVKFVTATTEFRYVRVGLNPDLTGNQLIATIGHELQHVAEIGNAPSVVSRETLTALYRVVGSENYARSDEWETVAAQRAGDLVRRELASPGVGLADSTQARLRDRK